MFGILLPLALMLINEMIPSTKVRINLKKKKKFRLVLLRSEVAPTNKIPFEIICDSTIRLEH